MRLIQLDGSNEARGAETDLPADIRLLRPDDSGRRAAVAMATGEVVILGTDAEGGLSMRQWVRGGRCRALAWSPDGAQLAAELDGRLVVGAAEGAAQANADVPAASDLVWWQSNLIAVAVPVAWPPVALFRPDGVSQGTLAPAARQVSSHAPKLAVAHATGQLAFSYVRDAVAVFEANGVCRELPVPDPNAAPSHAITQRLQIMANGRKIATTAAPAKGDAETEIWIGDLSLGSFGPAIRIPASAALLFDDDLAGGLAAPLGSKQLIRWSDSGACTPRGTTAEPIWGLASAGRRLWLWGRRSVAVLDLD